MPLFFFAEKFSNSTKLPQSTNKLGTSAEKCILLCLWYLANTETFRQISDRFGIALSTAHTILILVVDFIISFKEEVIKWPNLREKRIISTEFKKKHGFKKVIGCIDGSHIKIHRPQKDEEVYVNRKGYHSILLQGICDHRKLFINVFCGEPGSLHDARLLRKSLIYRKAENPHFFEGYYLLGDSAYPSLPWLVPPFRDNGRLTEEHKLFNFKLSSTRMVIEHTFGLLKGRFRRLLYFENLSIYLIVKCVMAACVLHNMCILENDVFDEYETIPDNTEQNEFDRPEENVEEYFETRQQVFEEVIQQ